MLSVCGTSSVYKSESSLIVFNCCLLNLQLLLLLALLYISVEYFLCFLFINLFLYTPIG